MEPLDELLLPEIIESIAFSLIVVVVVTILAVTGLKYLVKIAPSDVPYWVWTLLIFLMVWSTQYLITSLINPEHHCR